MCKKSSVNIYPEVRITSYFVHVLCNKSMFWLKEGTNYQDVSASHFHTFVFQLHIFTLVFQLHIFTLLCFSFTFSHLWSCLHSYSTSIFTTDYSTLLYSSHMKSFVFTAGHGCSRRSSVRTLLQHLLAYLIYTQEVFISRKIHHSRHLR